jgi:hypothetical protein
MSVEPHFSIELQNAFGTTNAGRLRDHFHNSSFLPAPPRSAMSTSIHWSGHILPGNPNPNHVGGDWRIIQMLPSAYGQFINQTTGALTNTAQVDIYQNFILLHEVVHALGPGDHVVCNRDPEGSCSNRPYCDRCAIVPIPRGKCVMAGSVHNIITTPNHELFCVTCQISVRNYINANR